MITTSTRTRRSWFVTLLAAPALLIALTGCVSGGPDGTETKPGGGTAEQPATEAEFSAARDAYDLKLAECFRDKGLDVKDPLPGAGITESGPELQEAFPACSAEIGDPPTGTGIALTPDELQKLVDRAQCLRELGYEIQEPTVDNPGFVGGEVTEEDFDTCHTAAGF